jgi:hypothetical protein
MKTFTAGHVAVRILDGVSDFVGSPARGGPETTGTATLAELKTSDGFDALLGVITWPKGEQDVRIVDFISGAAPYERLIRAGTFSIKTSGDNWVALIRAMKVQGKEYATGTRVTWEELNWLAGSDFQAAATAHGTSKFGLYGSLSTTSGSAQKNDLALSCPAGVVAPMIYLYAITRVEAIMQQFGINGPKALN